MTGTIISFPPPDMLICYVKKYEALFKPLQKSSPMLHIYQIKVLLFSFLIMLRDRLQTLLRILGKFKQIH